MATIMAKRETLERKWYLIDAAGKPLGHTAAKAAAILRGDFVIIINAKDAVLTGKKLDQKFYRTHSGYAGGLKETKYRALMATKPELAMELAIKGMLPKNSIGRWSLDRAKIYAGPEHKNAAQKPVALED